MQRLIQPCMDLIANVSTRDNRHQAMVERVIVIRSRGQALNAIWLDVQVNLDGVEATSRTPVMLWLTIERDLPQTTQESAEFLKSQRVFPECAGAAALRVEAVNGLSFLGLNQANHRRCRLLLAQPWLAGFEAVALFQVTQYLARGCKRRVLPVL